MRIGSFEFDTVSGRLTSADGTIIDLRPNAAHVLRVLADAGGEVVPKDEIFDRVWPNVTVSEDSLYHCIAEIRRALADEGRGLLKTLPRRGYLLVVSDDGGGADGNVTVTGIAVDPRPRRWLAAIAAVLLCAVALGGWFALLGRGTNEGRPTLSLAVTGPESRLKDAVAEELRVVLGRYRTVALLSPSQGGDFHLNAAIRGPVEAPRVTLEIVSSDGRIVHADAFHGPAGEGGAHLIAARIGATVASPVGGAVVRNALEASKAKPVGDLSDSECYAHAYQINPQAQDQTVLRADYCLARITERDPENSSAWALTGQVRAHQYYYGSGLSADERADWSKRAYLAEAARAAADRASGDFADPAMAHFARAKAYFAECAGDRVMESIRRALAANPDDPWMLGAFGNWAAYSGHWPEGVEMANRALEILPDGNAGWWWWPIAKDALASGDYAAADAAFRKAYVEASWIDEVHSAQAMVMLGREAEARDAIQRLRALRPGITRDDLREAYSAWCFAPSFLDALDSAMAQAGLPSKVEEAALAAKPSIAVLPFRNLTGQDRWDLLAAALATDIANDLARNRWLYVTAPASAIRLGSGADATQAGWQLDTRFVLTGSIQEGAGQLRISASLTDAARGDIAWSDRWTRPETDIFSVQDEILSRIDAALGSTWTGAVVAYERARAHRRPTENLTAWELFHLGIEQKHRFNADGYDRAEAYLRSAIEADPKFAKAWTALSIVYLLRSELSTSSEEADALIDKQIAAVRKAVELDPDDPDVLVQSSLLHTLDGNPMAARRALRQAVATAPNNADVLATAAWGGSGRVELGQEAVDWADRAIELSPGHPNWYDSALGVALFHAEDYARAAEVLPTAAQTPEIKVFWAISLARNGDNVAAREVRRDFEVTFGANATVADLFASIPDYSGEALTRIEEGARLAGIPYSRNAAPNARSAPAASEPSTQETGE